jgi:broad specificity phosphatase PhoE
VARLILVRHGQSTFNAEGRLQGQLDPGLSERGRQEALALAPLLGRVRADRVASSDLARARETAELLGFGAATFDERWRELDLGDWSGRLAADVRAEVGDDAYAEWRAGRSTPPGAETHESMAARVAAAGRELLDAGGTTLAFTHGGPIRALCAELLGAPITRFAGLGNGSVTILESAAAGARLVAYNLGGAGGEDL